MGFPGSHPALEWLARALSLPVCPPPTPAHPLLHSQTGCMIVAALLTAFREVRAVVAPHRELYALPVMSCPDTDNYSGIACMRPFSSRNQMQREY